MYSANIIVTGANSGLGKYLCQKLKALPVTRATSLLKLAKHAQKKPFDLIVHAAFNSSFNFDENSLFAAYNDNLFFTQQLTALAHKKFIFISSIDVYERNLQVHNEDEIIKINNQSLYGVFKLPAEKIISKNCKNFLILRCSALLGKYSRKNSLIKILYDESPQISLQKLSQFNYILYEDVANFIQKSCNCQGIYNLASSTNITLAAIAKKFNVKPFYGNFIYKCGKISNSKAVAIYPQLTKSSLEKIILFASQHNYF